MPIHRTQHCNKIVLGEMARIKMTGGHAVYVGSREFSLKDWYSYHVKSAAHHGGPGIARGK